MPMDPFLNWKLSFFHQKIEHCPSLNKGCISQTNKPKALFVLGTGVGLAVCAGGVFCIAGDQFAAGDSPDRRFSLCCCHISCMQCLRCC